MIGEDSTSSSQFVAEWRTVTAWEELPHANEAALQTILSSASSSAFPGAILPWPRKNKQTVYYGIARTAAEWRRLRPLLLACAGPTVTEFTGALNMQKHYGAEQFFERHAFFAVVRLVPEDETETRMFVQRALERLCRTMFDNRATARQPSEPTSKLLGRLDGAIADGDRVAAEALLKRLRDEERVDGVNVRFLTVQIAAAFRDWRMILELPNFSDIVAGRRPAAVTSAILDALYAVHIAPAEERGATEAAFRPLVPTLRELLREPRPPLNPEGARLAELLDAVTMQAAEIVATPPGPGNALTQLVEAVRSDSLDVLRDALAAVDALDDAPRDTMMSATWVREMWREAAARAGRMPPPRTWIDWLESIRLPEYTNAFTVARTAAGRWSVAEQLGDAVAVAQLADALVAVPDGPPAERLAEVLPVLVRWLREDSEFPRPLLTPVYDALWTLLVLGVRRGHAELESSAALFDGLLASGLDAERYRELLVDALDLSGEPGRRTVYWLLGLVESTVDRPAPDEAARRNLWATALARVGHLRAQLSVLQNAALDRLVHSLGIQVAALAVDEPVRSGEPRLAGRRIAVYTLAESAARQARELLVTLEPTVKVSLHNDHVGTDSLRAAAEHADLFVIVTWAAKHAATDFIQRWRGDKPTAYAAGRGATSILRAIDEYAV